MIRRGATSLGSAALAAALGAALAACGPLAGSSQTEGAMDHAPARAAELAAPAQAVPRLQRARPEEVGMDPARLARVDSIIRDAIGREATPGAVLAVGRRGGLVHLQAYGRLDWRSGFGAVAESTIYDLASMTKVVATTTAAMLLVDDGALDLDAPINQFLDGWPREGAHARITARHLLTHASGLPAYGPLWRELRGREAFLRRIANTGLEYEPGAHTLYSDYGMIVLALALERIARQPLDAFLEARVFRPLGMTDTRFSPGQRVDVEAQGGGNEGSDLDPSLLTRIAPTELDDLFRHEHVHGAVHDENAYALGGVAGHAGLFSTARDLAVFSQMLLDGGAFGPVRLIRRETVESFTRRQSRASTRALGWDTPGTGSSAGDYFSARSFGHTGFTGTSIWIDPERELYVVLLTNRVNPSRANDRHVRMRRAVHDAIQLAITDPPPRRRPGSR